MEPTEFGDSANWVAGYVDPHIIIRVLDSKKLPIAGTAAYFRLKEQGPTYMGERTMAHFHDVIRFYKDKDAQFIEICLQP